MLIHINWSEVIRTWPSAWSMGTWGLSKFLSEERQLQNKAFTLMNLEKHFIQFAEPRQHKPHFAQFQVDSSFERQIDGASESGEKGSHQNWRALKAILSSFFIPWHLIVSFPVTAGEMQALMQQYDWRKSEIQDRMRVFEFENGTLWEKNSKSCFVTPRESSILDHLLRWLKEMQEAKDDDAVSILEVHTPWRFVCFAFNGQERWMTPNGPDCQLRIHISNNLGCTNNVCFNLTLFLAMRPLCYVLSLYVCYNSLCYIMLFDAMMCYATQQTDLWHSVQCSTLQACCSSAASMCPGEASVCSGPGRQLHYCI